MNKRPSGGEGNSHTHKKRRHDQQHRLPSKGQSHSQKERVEQPEKQKQAVPSETAASQLPPQATVSGPIPAYIPFSVSLELPPLPDIQYGNLSSAPFRHRSTSNYNRSISSSPTEDVTYERLEFLGDAYIEIIATRLIFERYAHLPAGQQSQLRELLVKNETLSEYSKAYKFDKKIDVGNMDRMIEDGKHKGNKGFNKVLGDVFEAYVAAVILSNVEDGFATAEKWLTTLWAPKLLEVSKSDASFDAARSLTDPGTADLTKIYNPNAKNELQKRILHNKSTALAYETYKNSIELKGDQLGQNRHFIALYLTGYGYERKLLGKGEGKNKVEAGNWAAIEAMHGDGKAIVDECEEALRKLRAERDAAKKAADVTT